MGDLDVGGADERLDEVVVGHCRVPALRFGDKGVGFRIQFFIIYIYI